MILIVGASRTNGHLVAEALLQAGVPVRAMVQNVSKATDLQRAAAQLVVAHLTKPETLGSALAGVDRSLMLSAVDERLVRERPHFVEGQGGGSSSIGEILRDRRTRCG